MLISEATWLAFAAFSGLRTISYVPQIIRIARDRNGASPSPIRVAAVDRRQRDDGDVRGDQSQRRLACLVSSSMRACCMVVIALTAFKRLAHRPTKGLPSRSNESDRMWTPAPAASPT
jgi:hypothetical protein